jgi:hypothetical protein
MGQITARILSSKVYDSIPGLCAAKSRNGPKISYLYNPKYPQFPAQRSLIPYALFAQNLNISCAFMQTSATFPNPPFYAQADATCKLVKIFTKSPKHRVSIATRSAERV